MIELMAMIASYAASIAKIAIITTKIITKPFNNNNILSDSSNRFCTTTSRKIYMVGTTCGRKPDDDPGPSLSQQHKV